MNRNTSSAAHYSSVVCKVHSQASQQMLKSVEIKQNKSKFHFCFLFYFQINWWSLTRRCPIIPTGPLRCPAKQRRPVRTDAGGGAPAGRSGARGSGRGYQGEGGSLENPAQETATGTRRAGEEAQAGKQVLEVRLNKM